MTRFSTAPGPNRVLRRRDRAMPWVGLLAAIALAGCGAPANYSESAGDMASMEAAGKGAAPAELASAVAAPKVQPLLKKEAEMSLSVESMEESLEAITRIARKYQGDVLRLEQDQPLRLGGRSLASLELRVPADKLEVALTELSQLGTVESRLITAEDVGEQMVDLQARLKNLRKSEEAVLKIMERSGSIGDVLKVSQELSTIRETIERIQAQTTRLQTQVAFSTIRLTLESITVSPNQSGRPVGAIAQQSWIQSTRAARSLALVLLRLAIWLFSFSPYFLLIGASIYGIRRWKRPKSLPNNRQPEPPTAN